MTDAPGLKRKRNKDGSVREYWMARSDLVKRGYRPSSVRLHYPESDEGRSQIAARCHILQAEMLAWASTGDFATPGYDGTLTSLSRLFQTDADSPYHSMKWNSRVNVTKSLVIVERTVGTRQIAKLLGPDFKRWHRAWGEPKQPDAPARPWRAKHTMDIVRQLIAYGVTLGFDDCFRADMILSKIRFPTPPARKAILTAAHVEAIRATAHAEGFPSIALATVLQFGLALRQKDVIGEWEPIGDGDGGIRYKGTRWVNGLTWSDIDADMILRKTHTKTGFDVEHDLTYHPAVLAEIAKVPADRRVGPIIISENTGEPYKHRNFTQRWRIIADRAGLPKGIWNMDARAGAITEAYNLGAAETDVMKSAGHRNRQTSARYNRGTIAQTNRVAIMRMEKPTENDR
ncbi:integrase [Aurantimonas sp. C2-5-R2]|uniref:integrase n=1 Tax=unclassified Aurantimonas TaxID=2638230 RepID=UPI002E188FEE|nr:MULTISPECIES: integrase [unclassified Aurantimonas]MEC5293742.1 integrase [Aurantimonas sp. C2-3-R2]MEC5414802.1 integrase [Aurantimonas sp. C2-4-R8]